MRAERARATSMMKAKIRMKRKKKLLASEPCMLLPHLKGDAFQARHRDLGSRLERRRDALRQNRPPLLLVHPDAPRLVRGDAHQDEPFGAQDRIGVALHRR